MTKTCFIFHSLIVQYNTCATITSRYASLCHQIRNSNDSYSVSCQILWYIQHDTGLGIVFHFLSWEFREHVLKFVDWRCQKACQRFQRWMVWRARVSSEVQSYWHTDYHKMVEKNLTLLGRTSLTSWIVSQPHDCPPRQERVQAGASRFALHCHYVYADLSWPLKEALDNLLQRDEEIPAYEVVLSLSNHRDN